MSDVARCELCGESMPDGEQMFKYHGYSGPCPKPQLPRAKPATALEAIAAAEAFSDILHEIEARGVELTPKEDRMWQHATAAVEELRKRLP